MTLQIHDHKHEHAVCDQCVIDTDTHIIELENYRQARDLERAYDKVVGEVDKEADEIWKQTHGCETCSKHWGMDFENPTGDIPVWDECPDCEGKGEVI